MSNVKINYVVACFVLDPRSTAIRCNVYHKIDKYFAIKYHVTYINSIPDTNVVKTTFVINRDEFTNEAEICDVVKQYNIHNRDIEVKFRDNWGLSYGAWEYHIRQTLDVGYDYYFLTEDDYCICHPEFYIPFLCRMNDQVGFVCGEYRDNHPAVSYKLISPKVCQKIYNKYGEIFSGYNRRLNSDDKAYEEWQANYHLHFLSENYELRDVSRDTAVIYSWGNPTRYLTLMNNAGIGSVMISPVGA